MIKSLKGSHIVLRIKSTIKIRGHELDVIAEHNRVFDKIGCVGVGKFGASWNQSRCNEFNTAIKNGVPTNLFIVSKTANGYRGFRAPIRVILLSGNTKGHVIKFPEYYNELHRQPALYETALSAKPSMWFLLAGRLESHPLVHLRLLSNGRPLLDVLSDSRPATMLVLDRQKPH